MRKAIWFLQVIVALAFTGSGAMKLLTPSDTLRANPSMAWSTGFNDGQIKAIGAAEVAGAVGLVAPAATGILPILTPLAGVALALLMSGAAYTHVERAESPVGPLVLGILALAAALLRWRVQRQTTTSVTD
jgi:hypothetical protein